MNNLIVNETTQVLMEKLSVEAFQVAMVSGFVLSLVSTSSDTFFLSGVAEPNPNMILFF